MEIEVGTYIRTDKGYIFHNLSSMQISGLKLLSPQYGNIVKHSKDILNLIEVGDFVNGNRVIELIRLNNKEISICVFKDREYMHCEILKENNVKTILTHEQYKQNCYRLEE